MPKRSLNTGNNESKKIEQLNKAVDAMLARTDGRALKLEAEIEPLVRIAAELRNLPSASFKARLKSQLEGKRKWLRLLRLHPLCPNPCPHQPCPLLLPSGRSLYRD